MARPGEPGTTLKPEQTFAGPFASTSLASCVSLLDVHCAWFSAERIHMQLLAAPSLAPVCVPHLVGQLVARVPACPLARRLGFVRRGRGGLAGRRAPVADVLGLVPAVPVFGNSCPA